MPDDSSTGQPVGDSSGEVPPEGSIDDLLAGAADLAAGLGEEVGMDSSTGAPSSAAASPLAQDTPDRATIDAQLDEIESLLDAAGQDLGADAPESDATTLSGPPISAQQEEASHPVPSATQAPSPSAPAPAGAGMLTAQELAEFEGTPEGFPGGDVLQSLDDSFDDADRRAQEPFEEFAAGAPTALTDDDRDWSGPANRAPGVLYRTLDRAVDLLELFDHPFVWVGYGARRVVGWAALATIFAAGCIFVASHIQ